MAASNRDPARLREIRKRLGLSGREMGLALGYGSGPLTRGNMIAAMERGEKAIPETVWRLAECLDYFGEVPEEWLVEPDDDAP